MKHLVIVTVATMLTQGDASGLRVRSSHPYIVAIITEAQVRSTTFRGLIHTIEGTDGIVYVEEGDCHRPARACLPPVMTSAGGFRFLRVLVDARQQDWDVMADIGHELQHAIEILRDSRMRSSESLLSRMLTPGKGIAVDLPETQAAIATGNAVRNEVKAFARNGSTKGLSQIIASDEAQGATSASWSPRKRRAPPRAPGRGGGRVRWID